MRKGMSKPTFFKGLRTLSRINAKLPTLNYQYFTRHNQTFLGGNQPLDIHLLFFSSKEYPNKIEMTLEFYSVTGFFANHELIKFLIVGIS